MCRVPHASLTPQKKQLLADSQTTPPIYIFLEKYQYDEEVKAVVYDCQIGIQENADVVIHVIKTRFSQLAKLDKYLHLSHLNLEQAKPFPQKRWFGNTDEKFLAERCRDLQDYLSSLTRIAGLLDEESFRKFGKLPIEGFVH
jgi:hypothetical protein